MYDVTVPMLWLPIVLSAVFVMIGSTVVWMALKYENTEWKPIPGEDQLRDVVRKLNLPTPGQYIFPHMMGEGGPEAAMKKAEEGPTGVLLLRKPAKFSMAPMLGKAFIYYLIVSFFVAYVASHALPKGTEHHRSRQSADARDDHVLQQCAAPRIDSRQSDRQNGDRDRGFHHLTHLQPGVGRGHGENHAKKHSPSHRARRQFGQFLRCRHRRLVDRPGRERRVGIRG